MYGKFLVYRHGSSVVGKTNAVKVIIHDIPHGQISVKIIFAYMFIIWDMFVTKLFDTSVQFNFNYSIYCHRIRVKRRGIGWG